MGAMPGNRERKDCQIEWGVRDSQKTKSGERVKTDKKFNENQAKRVLKLKGFKWEGFSSIRALVAES